MEWKRNIRKVIVLAASLGVMFYGAMLGHTERVVEARAQVRVADREMKKSRDYQKSDLYERARRIIYGQNPPSGPEGRVRIAIVINGDENIIVHERVKDEIYMQLRKKFPREEFAVMKGSDVNTKLLEIAEDKAVRGTAYVSGIDSPYNVSEQSGYGGYEEHRTPSSVGVNRPADIDGLPLERTRPNGISYLKRDDFVRAGRECGYDYLFVATFSNGESDVERHWWVLYNSKTRKNNVWLRLRFVDVENGDYLYRNDIVAQGETGGSSGKPRTMQRAVREAMKEALADIEVTY